jgi:hypothetical protein
MKNYPKLFDCHRACRDTILCLPNIHLYGMSALASRGLFDVETRERGKVLGVLRGKDEMNSSGEAMSPAINDIIRAYTGAHCLSMGQIIPSDLKIGYNRCQRSSVGSQHRQTDHADVTGRSHGIGPRVSAVTERPRRHATRSHGYQKTRFGRTCAEHGNPR